MKGTYFVVDMDELVDFADTVKSEMILLEESLGDFENSIAALVGMDSFQGESAEAVKQYFDEVYSTIISGIYLCCDDMRAASSLYLEKYLEVDSNRNALIGEEAMYNLKRDVTFYVSALLSEIDIINNAINKVDDFAAVEKLSRNKLEEYSEDETRFINKKRAKVEQIESNMMNGTIKKAKDMVNSTSKIINNYKNNIKSLETYKSGDFSKVDGIDDYIENLNRSKKFLEDNSDKINEAERIVDEMSTSKKIAKEKQDNLGYTLWHMFWNAPVHVIDKAEDALLKLYGNVEKISWLPGPVKSNIRGFTGDASKGYGNNLFEIKYGIDGAIARGGLDFVLEGAKGVFELVEEAPHLIKEYQKLRLNVRKEGFKLFFNPKEVIEDAQNTKDKVVAIAKSVPSKLDDCRANFLKKNDYEKISAITKVGLEIYFIVQSGKSLLKDAKKVENITKTTQTIKVSTEVEETSKLTKEAEKTSKLVKETETT
ncbi:MAG: LXG domain-containing protein, partial [Lachnospiraceae bacterium]|nr:LXG domain-containing protein [Lachnospiraceae bacterium]